MTLPRPIPVDRALAALGTDLSRARRRRRLSQASFAERCGISVATVRRLEKGDPGVAIEHLARALYLLGELPRLEALIDTRDDKLGLALVDEQLPLRVRARPGSGAL
jgi:transcriptional regulator with XRE-family HTH domain